VEGTGLREYVLRDVHGLLEMPTEQKIKMKYSP